MFAVFTFMGTMASFIFSEVFEEKVYTEGGILSTIDSTGFEYVHVANIVVVSIQIIACIMCALKTIHVPHTPYTKEDEPSLSDKYIWKTHEAIFLMIASGVNSNLLAEKFFESKFFVSVYIDSTINIMGNDDFHTLLRDIMIYCRFAFAGIAWSFILYNLFVKGASNQYKTQLPNLMELASLLAVSAIFISQAVYSIIHFVELYPDSFINKFHDAPAIVKERHLEFVSENISELSLSVIGLMLTWYSVPTTDTANSLATTELFNTMFLGFFGAFHAVRSAFAVHVLEGDINTAWVPLVVFVVGAGVSLATRAIASRSDMATVGREQVFIFYDAIGRNYSLVSFLWKLSLAGGIAAFFVAGFSTQAQWFTFDFRPGVIPLEVAHTTENIVGDVVQYGEKAFNIIKDIDPCRWGIGGEKRGTSLKDFADYGKATKGVNGYDFGERHQPAKSKFALDDVDLSKPQPCLCKSGSHNCGCDQINKARDVNNQISQDKDAYARTFMDDEFNSFNGNFSNWSEDSRYHDHMKHCHSLECDAVLGVAIAAETAIISADLLSFLPFVGEVVDTVAWFGQMGNRVAHNVVSYSIRLGKILTGLSAKIKYLVPLVEMLVAIEKKTFQESFAMSLDLLIVYAPLMINGALCILIAFWRRENVHKLFQTYGVIVTFYIPLTILNASMYGLMHLFPFIIKDVVKVIPSKLFVVTPKEHVGFTMLRNAYLMATVASFLLFVSSLLDDAYHLRKKAANLRAALREWYSKPNPRTGADVGSTRKTLVDMGWFQAATISIVIPVLFVMSYSYEWKFVDMRYGPTGNLLKLVNSFHGHTNMLQENQAHNSFVEENSLCGLIGKVVGELVEETINELTKASFDIGYKLSNFTNSIFHFSDVISSFEAVGTKGADILHEVWDMAEKTLVLIVPLMLSILITATAVVLPRVSDAAKEEIEKTVKQLVMIGVYYNVALLVMMTQLFHTVSNIDLHVFYFRFEPGYLVPIGFIASGLNAMSLFSLYVNKIYRAES